MAGRPSSRVTDMPITVHLVALAMETIPVLREVHIGTAIVPRGALAIAIIPLLAAIHDRHTHRRVVLAIREERPHIALLRVALAVALVAGAALEAAVAVASADGDKACMPLGIYEVLCRYNKLHVG